MESLRNILPRDVADGMSASTVNLMIALLSIVFFGLVLGSILVLLRKLRQNQRMRDQTLPQYQTIDEKRSGNPRGLTIHTTSGGAMRSSVIVFDRDGQPMLANPRSAPHSPDNVPEIHITFPDEQDEQGRQKSGRVVVVRVGEAGAVGLEPLHDEQLPAYEKESKSQFYAIDMDGIGGLKEKQQSNYH
jgi:hypothetical protein